MYFDIEVKTQEIAAQYGPGFDAILKDLGVVVYQIAPNLLSRDPGFRGVYGRKQTVPFWDVLRYTCHGKAAIKCCNTSVQLIMTRNGVLEEHIGDMGESEQMFTGPKVVIDTVSLSYASGTVDVNVEDVSIHQPQFSLVADTKYAKSEPLLRIPGCNMKVTMTWECDGKNRTHHLYPRLYKSNNRDGDLAFTDALTDSGDWRDAFDRFRANGLRANIEADILPRLQAVLYSNALESLLYLGKIYGPDPPMPIQPVKSPAIVRNASWSRSLESIGVATSSATLTRFSSSFLSTRMIGRLSGTSDIGIAVNNIAAFALLDLVAITREIRISRVQVNGMDAWVYERAPELKLSKTGRARAISPLTDQSASVCLAVDSLSAGSKIHMITKRKRRGQFTFLSSVISSQFFDSSPLLLH